MAPEIDFAAEGLLDGLEAGAREQRVELLTWLAESGLTAEQLRRGHEEGLLLFTAAERLVAGDRRYTMTEVADRAGISLGLLDRLRRSQGLPVPALGERVLTEADLDSAATTRAFLDLGLGEEQIIATARVIGRAMAPVADAMRATLLGAVLEPGGGERALAERYATAAEVALPLARRMIQSVLSMHLANAMRLEAPDAVMLADGRLPGTRRIAVAFADLVGFTPLGAEIPPEELGAVADRLVAIAGDVVAPPVRLVKTIGDAVMLVSPEPAPLVAAGLEIAETIAAAGDDLPQVRVGIAIGQATSRGGDWFGSPVNLASRVTAIARAGSVLATREVRDATRGQFAWSAAGARKLKGFPDPVPLYRARAGGS